MSIMVGGGTNEAPAAGTEIIDSGRVATAELGLLRANDCGRELLVRWFDVLGRLVEAPGLGVDSVAPWWEKCDLMGAKNLSSTTLGAELLVTKPAFGSQRSACSSSLLARTVLRDRAWVADRRSGGT